MTVEDGAARWLSQIPSLAGFLAPFIMIPLLLGGSKEGGCCYCISTTLTTLLTDVLPNQVTAFLPVIMLELLGFPNIHRCYLSPSVLREMAAVLIILCTNCSSLMTRTALMLLDYCGTRMRNLLFSCLWMAATSSLFLDNTAVVLIMVAIVERTMRALKDDVIQQLHQRSLFEKATARCPDAKKKALKEALFTPRGEDGTPVGTATPASIFSSSISTDDTIMGRPATHPPTGAKSPFHPKHTPLPHSALPPKSAMANRNGRCWQPKRQLSILDHGVVIQPGVSSPPPKPSLRRELYRFAPSSVMRPGLLKDVVFWESRRYKDIQQDLIVSVTVTSFLASMVSLAGNSGNHYFVRYFKTRFGEEVITNMSWWTVMLPVVTLTMFTYWKRCNARFLEKYDARLDREAELAIQVVIRKQKCSLGTLRFLDYVPGGLLLSWLCYRTLVAIEDTAEKAPYHGDSFTVDYLVVLLFFAVPYCGSHVTRVVDRFLSFRELKNKVPWSAIMMYGGSTSMAFAIRDSSAAEWVLGGLLQSRHYGKLITQALLTLWASLITELVGNVATVSILLPISVEVALKVPCNPLYFAIPITAASSTTLIFPTSSMAMAYVQERLHVNALRLMFIGLLLKCTGVAVVLLSVGTVGNVVFTWSQVPKWAAQITANTTS